MAGDYVTGEDFLWFFRSKKKPRKKKKIKEPKRNMGVLASGNGSNFQAIVDALKKGRIRANIKLLVCDNPEAYCLQRAAKVKVKAFIADRRDFSNKKDF